MAELTKLEAKIAEVTGLAMAAQAATQKVIALTKQGERAGPRGCSRANAPTGIRDRRAMHGCAGKFEGKKTAILEEARATKSKGAEMMSTYLDADADALDGFEFLTMAEAGEVGHWSVLKTLNKSAGDDGIAALVDWALPIQQQHLEGVMKGSLQLASQEDPSEPA